MSLPSKVHAASYYVRAVVCLEVFGHVQFGRFGLFEQAVRLGASCPAWATPGMVWDSIPC
jgi:hypothetical protein